MTLIGSIGAGMFSDLSVHTPATELDAADQLELQDVTLLEAAYTALFADEIASAGGTPAAGKFVRIPNVREFPGLGIPPNIVNVPRYGARNTAQIQGQADSPNFEVVLNYVPAEWGSDTLLGARVGDGTVRAFRFMMLNSQPLDGYASLVAEIGQVENAIFYFLGKMEAISYSPQLTDANQATLTISMLSDFFGAFTVDPA